MAAVNLSYLLNLKPEEIIKWFESKGNVIPKDWEAIYNAAKASASTAIDLMKIDILQTVRDEIKKGLEEGLTSREVANNLLPKLEELGWLGNKKAKDIPGYDPSSGVDPEKIIVVTPQRLKFIYDQNASAAYNQGRYKFQMDNTATHPYLKYIQVQRPSKREEHAQYNGKVFRADDPIWNTIYPPNGFNCGCRVVAKSKSDLKQEGLTLSKGNDFDTSDIPEEWAHPPGESYKPDLSKYDHDLVAQYNRSNN
jgi:SPP1 gp7 family putative phage head morphogenesis protein